MSNYEMVKKKGSKVRNSEARGSVFSRPASVPAVDESTFVLIYQDRRLWVHAFGHAVYFPHQQLGMPLGLQARSHTRRELHELPVS